VGRAAARPLNGSTVNGMTKNLVIYEKTLEMADTIMVGTLPPRGRKGYYE
jgi:hypothetical protein